MLELCELLFEEEPALFETTSVKDVNDNAAAAAAARFK